MICIYFDMRCKLVWHIMTCYTLLWGSMHECNLGGHTQTNTHDGPLLNHRHKKLSEGRCHEDLKDGHQVDWRSATKWTWKNCQVDWKEWSSGFERMSCGLEGQVTRTWNNATWTSLKVRHVDLKHVTRTMSVTWTWRRCHVDLKQQVDLWEADAWEFRWEERATLGKIAYPKLWALILASSSRTTSPLPN